MPAISVGMDGPRDSPVQEANEGAKASGAALECRGFVPRQTHWQDLPAGRHVPSHPKPPTEDWHFPTTNRTRARHMSKT